MPRRRTPLVVATVVVPAVVAGAVLTVAPAEALAPRAAPTPVPVPAITLAVAAGPVGTDVAVSGTGFAARKAGILSAGSRTARFTTTAAGAFTTRIAIPRTALSTVRITATAGTRSAAAPFTVTTAVTRAPAAPTPAPSASASAAPAAPAATAAPAISSARLRLGASTPGGPTASSELDALAASVGESPSIVMSHVDFTRPAPVAGLASVAARGADSLVTWEPWQGGAGVDQPAYANARIIAGDFDPYIRAWAADLAQAGTPVFLRYGHEMNGNWYPWSDGVNGNASGSYAAAWRHVHDVVAAAGATNVRWVWTPNVPYPGSTDLAGLYPGDAYVDVVGLDGYNWGTSAPGSAWTDPASLFGPGLSRVRAIAPGKPVVIAETASTETGGSKPAWIRDLVAYLQAQPDVVGFVWFDFAKEQDWRLASSPASAAALADALALRRG